MRTSLRHAVRLAGTLAVALPLVLTGTEGQPLDETGARSAAARTHLPVHLPEGSTRSPQLPPWRVEPQTTLVAKADRDREVRVAGPRGSRVWTASALASHDLPQAALEAYRAAAAAMASADPSCQLPWTLLAGVGRVESDHGRYDGSVLSAGGVSRPAIIGVALDGRGPVAAIRDTDDGKLDRDEVWDRAVGPMQFIPSTWAYAGRDGDGDGVENPHDLDDAALAAASYLCSGTGSLLVDATAKAAIFRYNPSDYYVALVQAFERGYRTGVFVIPSPPAPAQEAKARKRRDRDPRADGQQRESRDGRPRPAAQDDPRPKPTPKPSPKPTPKPSPKPSPTPTPTPSPSAPALEARSGTLAPCGSDWCLAGKTLDLGPDSQVAASAAHDYDRDGDVESNLEELTGLSGTEVSLLVGSGTTPMVVYVLAGEDYRGADGSFL